MQDFRTIR